VSAARRVAVVARSVYPFHGVGGLERSVYDLIRYLASAGAAVTLVTRVPDHEVMPGEIHPALRLKLVPYRTFPFAGRRGTTVLDRSTAYPLFGNAAGAAAADLVRRGQAHVVHGFGASCLGYARQRHHLDAPLVLNPQGLEEFGATDPSRARLKRAAYLPLRKAVIACARAADRIIATDTALEPALRRHLGVRDDRVRVIPNALDLDWVGRLTSPGDARRVRTQAGIGPDEVAILSAGRIEENKGFHILADALAALQAHTGLVAGGRWRWVIAGDGPYRATLERTIRTSGLAGHAVLLGRVGDADLHAWYEAATLFVHPTLYEGSSLVTLEAMAHRRAVVATTAGGLPDKVQPGVSGWLVPPGDRAALAAAISGAVSDLPRLGAMGDAGRQIVERRFSWAAAGAATMALYDELLGAADA
jgi:glycosyltransferase involved in cell wall biosynthesis